MPGSLAPRSGALLLRASAGAPQRGSSDAEEGVKNPEITPGGVSHGFAVAPTRSKLHFYITSNATPTLKNPTGGTGAVPALGHASSPEHTAKASVY